MKLVRWLASAALLAGLVPAQASAQTVVPFDTVSRGAMGAPGAPRNLVIRTAQELRDAGLADLVPDTVRIDWGREMVLAACMGTRNTGGYSIEVESIERRRMVTIQPVPPPPPRYQLIVSVRSRRPAPGQPVTMVITSPFHLVKVPAYPNDRVEFVDATAPPPPSYGPLAFTTLHRGTTDGPAAARRELVEDRSDLEAFFAPRAVPNVQVDFDRQTVIGVALGERPTAGYAVEIAAVELQQGPTVGPSPGVPVPHPGPDRLVVTVRERRPGPSDVVADVITTPVHLVVLDRVPDGVRVAFVDAAGPQLPFDSVTRFTRNQVRSLDVRVASDGAVRVQRTAIHAHYAPLTGQASPAELRALADAVQRARFDTIPGDIAPQNAPLGSVRFTFTVEGGAAPATVEGVVGFEAQFSARLRRVNETLDAIVARIEAGPQAFSRLGLTLTRGLDSSSTATTVEASGAVVVQRSRPNALIAPVNGQATADELRALEEAVSLADLASMPPQLPVPVHIVAGDTFELDVASPLAANQNHIRGEPGYLLDLESRLRPVLLAVQRITDRVAPLAPGTDSASGRVWFHDGEVFLQESKSMSYRVADADIARTLRAFDGHPATVEGAVTRTGPWSSDVAATRIVSPERTQTRRGLVSLPPGGAPRLQLDPGGAGASAPALVFGPAADILRAAVGRVVTFDGWVFADGHGVVREVFVESVLARVTSFSTLTRNGSWVGMVHAGQRVTVLSVTRNGRYATVRAGTRRGTMLARKLEIGEAFGPTTGIIGGLNDGQ